jgi:hypothetical protein
VRSLHGPQTHRAVEKPLPAYLATPALPSQGGLDGCQSRGPTSDMAADSEYSSTSMPPLIVSPIIAATGDLRCLYDGAVNQRLVAW